MISAAGRRLTLALASLLGLWAMLSSTGCVALSYLGSTDRGEEFGKTWYIGGAGSIGTVVGTTEVPNGLRHGKYRGAIEVFGWQAVLGGTIRDQIDRGRNLDQAHRLARRIEEYMDAYPDRSVNIVALSAGTGIATWALESLPEHYRIHTVVFLASSLSRGYDLSEMLRRIDGHLYVFSSPRDPILANLVPIAGSVDREWGVGTAAGLYGFQVPPNAGPPTRELYRLKMRHRPYRSSFARYGYNGLHTDAARQRFIERVVTPLILNDTIVVSPRAAPAPEAAPPPAPATPPGE